MTEITPYGQGVYSLKLVTERSIPQFQPGQFLHLAIDPYDPSSFWPDSRAFSIASSHSQPTLEIVYSVVGRFTKRMEQELAVGKEVWVKMPYGDFVIETTIEDSKGIVLISGGTGVTAFISFIRNLASQSSYPVHLVYGARSSDLLIYAQEVSEVARKNKNFTFQLLAETAQDLSSNLTIGRIATEVFWSHLKDHDSLKYYLSGPPQMIKNLSEQLAQKGIDRSKIMIDAWD